MLQQMKNVLAILDDNKPTLQALASINLPAGVNAEALVLQELDYLKQIAFTKPAILECIPDTIVYAVKSCLKNNLTLDPSAGLVYVKTRNVKVGTEWKKALEITPSCNGILSINYQCGKVIDHKNPEVIKDGTGKVIGVEFEYRLYRDCAAGSSAHGSDGDGREPGFQVRSAGCLCEYAGRVLAWRQPDGRDSRCGRHRV